MPNGPDADFQRFLRAIASFRKIFGRWPSKMMVTNSFISELKSAMKPADLNILNSKIKLIPDDDPWDWEIPYLASDDLGNYYQLLEGKCSKEISNEFQGSIIHANDVIDWLGIDYPEY